MISSVQEAIDAVRKNGLLLSIVPFEYQTEAVALTAVQQNREAAKYVKPELQQIVNNFLGIGMENRSSSYPKPKQFTRSKTYVEPRREQSTFGRYF